MNYIDFYTNTKRRTTEALLSMWAIGKKETQEYLKHVFEEEPILAEPVFQSMFPWQSDIRKFDEFRNLFDDKFIDALSGIEDKKFNFPKDRKPYMHQSESWKQLLDEKKSIVVTSGTGSGKTECFMIPIIYDLMRQQNDKKGYGKNNLGGVQAIFLYPLNALMSSQQKRMSAWCRAVNPQVTFAMYKGDTEENFKQIMKDALPELKSREQIRKTPPQILFTNPTMLEYMLVRKQDKKIIDVSKDKKSLRWIVLDEAHTYSGSSAAELALQIRRILDAFGVTIDDVRFAATSATLGSGADGEYKNFLSLVTGKKQEDIVVIHGYQILPTIETATLNSIISKINMEFDGKFKLSNEKILALREELRKNTLSVREITNRFSTKQDYSIEVALRLIDRLSEKNDVLLSDIDSRGALLPTRSHFFIRNMGGLYACVDPECSKHKEFRIDLGSLTTNIQTECPDCHSKLIEVNRCNSCGNLLLVGQEQGGYYGFAKRETLSLFEMENNEDDTEEEPENFLDDAVKFVLAKGVAEEPVNNSILMPKTIDFKAGKINGEKSDFVECRKNNRTIICPYCGERTDKLQSLYSGNLFSRLLAPTLLEQTAPETDDRTSLWQGRKYISFTDNRQGTAKSTFRQNIEVERNWIRTAIYHYLADERRKTLIPVQGLTDAEEGELCAIKQFNPDSPRVNELEYKKHGNTTPSNPPKRLNDFANTIIGNSELEKLFNHLPDSFKIGKDENAYLKQLMIDQFGRRPRRVGVNNPETMGLVKVVYPAIENAIIPDEIQSIFNNLKWKAHDWNDFLKIALDYFFREDRHIEVPVDTKIFRTLAFINSDVYPPSSKQKKKFPSLSIKNNDTVKNPNRLVVLLLLAMGIKREDEISEQHETYINQLLSATWNFLRQNVLTPNTEEERGYKLDLLGDKAAYQIMDKAWICPVNQVPLDTVFRGYSPLLTSRIASNLEKYKITEPPVEYPYFPYAYKNDNNHNRIGDETIINWMSENLKHIQNKGLWSNMHERILLYNPVYLSAEHTAQQSKDKLRAIENDFENHKLNILSCSTTMEMGVDISGISEVVMNNVPPKPANYLQRAGRAGRGSETKALVLTFCNPDPIGSNVFNNPKWAMTHKTAVPMVSFDSNMLVQRHVNSFLLSSYIATDGENNLTVSSSVINFFFPENGQINHNEQFRQYLNTIVLNGNTSLCERYKKLTEDTCKHTIPFTDSVNACLSDLEKIGKELEDRKTMLENKIKCLLSADYNENSPATRAVSSQRNKVLSQNILGFFAEHNFIPSASIPIGIVDFDKYNIADYKIEKNKKEGKEGYEYHFGYQQANPSMLLTQAITEYAPGNQIVLNEACYVSRGIVLKSQWDNARRVIFQYCPKCGYAITKEGDALSKCPHCKNERLKGIKSGASNFAPLIEPVGFRVDFSEEPTRTINSHNSKNYTQPELLNMLPWEEQDELSNVKLELRHSNQSNAEILYYNLGNGNGYAVCLECGRTVPDIKDDNLTEALKELHLLNHTPIIGGKKARKDREKCSNNNIKRNVLLGGRFQTDFVEIRFRDKNGKIINDEETVFSLGVILTQKLTEKIGVNSQEINFGIKQYHNYFSIFIYDTAKGGAGYSIRFNELKEEVIDLSKVILESCKCKKACDKCLINRESQWYIDRLNRIKALEWLKLEINSRNNVPENVKLLLPDTKIYSLTNDFMSEIQNVLINMDLMGITFFIDNDIAKWTPKNWKYFEPAKELRIKGKQVSFAFENSATELKTLSEDQLSDLGEICLKFRMQTINNPAREICSFFIAELSGNRYIHYFTTGKEHSNGFDDRWATATDLLIYKAQSDCFPYHLNVWTPKFTFSNDNEIFIRFSTQRWNTTSRQLLDKLCETETERWNTIFDRIRGKNVSITYTDRYLNSPLACRLIVDLINNIREKAHIKISKINFNLSNIPGAKNDERSKDRKNPDFYSVNQRTEYLMDYTKSILGIDVIPHEGYLPHARDFRFDNSEFELGIYPDSGVGGGMNIDYREHEDWKDDFDNDVKVFTKGDEVYTVVYKTKKN